MDKAKLIARLSAIYQHLNPAYDYDLEDVQHDLCELIEVIKTTQEIA